MSSVVVSDEVGVLVALTFGAFVGALLEPLVGFVLGLTGLVARGRAVVGEELVATTACCAVGVTNNGPVRYTTKEPMTMAPAQMTSARNATLAIRYFRISAIIAYGLLERV